MEKDTLSLREAAKLMDFAPQTVKNMIKKGTLKATTTGKGRMRRYTIAAKDLPSNGHSKSKVGRPKKVLMSKKTRTLTDKAAKSKATVWVSGAIEPAALPEAEVLLRSCFLQWLTERLLSK